jgi:hypothetical protein
MGIRLEQYAENQDRAAQAEIPRWIELADELETARKEMFASSIRYDRLNGADVMALSFATKQAEHLRSVRLLISAKQHRDAYLIARTMLEGYGRLLWSFSRAEERPDLWLWYGAILDWRQLRKNEAARIVVDPDDKAMLQEYVDQHGDNYLDPKKIDKARKRAEKDGAEFSMPDDPWGKDWARRDVRSMFEEIGADTLRLYDSAYRRSSEWVHSGPRAILIAASANADRHPTWGINEFTEEDWPAAAVALGLGCLSLLQSLEVVNKRFSVGAGERLANIQERFDNQIRHSVGAVD